MKTFEFKYASGATPLDPNEIDGLIPDYITTQSELNILERNNILEAEKWAHSKKHSEVLRVSFCYNLHKRMFGHVWKWAGNQRRTNKNIGVPKEQIPNQLGLLFEDTKHWINNNTYSWDIIGARFHYRLVSVHIFPNGNGRHARLMTDILLESNEQQSFSWGMKTAKGSLDVEGNIRKKYISALKEADANRFEMLLRFVKS